MEDKQTSNNEQLNKIIVEYKKMLQEKLAQTKRLILQLESYQEELSAIINKI